MRRTTNLFEQIPVPENLRLAFHKASRGRRGQAVVRQFAAELDRRIVAMSEGIRTGTFPLGRFQQFLVRDPKERVITAPCFDERVLHHSVMNVCEPALGRWLIDKPTAGYAAFFFTSNKGGMSARCRRLEVSVERDLGDGLAIAGRHGRLTGYFRDDSATSGPERFYRATPSGDDAEEQARADDPNQICICEAA